MCKAFPHFPNVLSTPQVQVCMASSKMEPFSAATASKSLQVHLGRFRPWVHGHSIIACIAR